jgi:hypothetical protein
MASLSKEEKKGYEFCSFAAIPASEKNKKRQRFFCACLFGCVEGEPRQTIQLVRDAVQQRNRRAVSQEVNNGAAESLLRALIGDRE